MLMLAIDRSAGRPGMAVFEDGRLVFAESADGEPSRAPEWIADLAETLKARDLPADAFDRFVCGLGPGSFSGIRACLSLLQGLALPGGKPVCGVASAAALALGQSEGGGRVTVIGDARRGRLWCVTYEAAAGDGATLRLADGRLPTHTADDFQLIPVEKLAETVPDGTKIVSSDWERLKGLLSDTFVAERLVARAAFPRAEDVGRLAIAEPSACVPEPLPIYLHPAVAVKPEPA